jgi:Xaa-Pro aminopeptidase
MTVLSPAGISANEYERRIDACRQAAGEEGLDALIAYSHSLKPGHVLYLTGYVPFNGAAVVLVSADSCRLFTDANWDLAAARSASWLEAPAVDYAEDFADALKTALDPRARRVGIIGFDLLPASVYTRLAEITRCRYEDSGRILEGFRAIKSEQEIALIRDACRITDAGTKAFAEQLQAGITELELAVAVESAIKRAGTHRLTFPTNLGSGQRTVFVSPSPTTKRIEEGDLVLLDCGGTFAGYCADVARAGVVGRASAEQRRLLDGLHQIYQECRSMLTPGRPLKDIHQTASAIASRLGLPYGFDTGHSIGTENHEYPVIDLNATEVLEPNMVVTIEPSVILEAFGARLEDTFLITESGGEALTTGSLRLWE